MLENVQQTTSDFLTIALKIFKVNDTNCKETMYYIQANIQIYIVKAFLEYVLEIVI